MIKNALRTSLLFLFTILFLFLGDARADLLIGPFAISPTSLPAGFTATSAVKKPDGTVYIGGRSGNQAAYVTVSGSQASPVVSTINILPSLSVTQGGGNPLGFLSDVVVNASGAIEFLGSSQSVISSTTSFGEATVWNENGVPTGLGLGVGGTQSLLVGGNSIGIYGGLRNGSFPVVGSLAAGNLTSLPMFPGSLGGGVTGVSSNGLTLTGHIDGTPAYWTASVLGGGYTAHQFTIPGVTNPEGFVYGQSGNLAGGIYYDDTLEDFVGAVFDLTTGSSLISFANLGPVIGGAFAATIAGQNVFAFNQDAAYGGSFFWVQGAPDIIRLSSLIGSSLPGLGTAVQIVDIFEGSLGILLAGNNGAFAVTSFQASANDVPEPTTLLLVGLGGAAMLRKRRRAN